MSARATDQSVRYGTHIKPLFRTKDIQSMRRKFDLGSYDDVSANADKILGKLQAGKMPCDGAWPPQNVELFKRWVEGGKLP